MLLVLLLVLEHSTAQLANWNKWWAYLGYDMHPDNGSIILDPADWSFECDPWKKSYPVNDSHYELGFHAARDPSDTYICPENMRSPSGCGDFRSDPRDVECSDLPTEDTDICSDQRVAFNDPDKVWQWHVCVQHPIYYSYKSTTNQVWPPSTGRHRERWPKYGEYSFIPEQRWLHSAEHGAMIFLYNPCQVTANDVCKLRNFIYGVPDYFSEDQRFHAYGTDDEGQVTFRFILTPYKDLRRKFSIIAFNGAFFSNCFNAPGMLDFIDLMYRRAHEDYYPSGAYDYLWTDYMTAGGDCTVGEAGKSDIFDNLPDYSSNPKSDDDHDTLLIVVSCLAAFFAGCTIALAIVLIYGRTNRRTKVNAGIELGKNF